MIQLLDLILRLAADVDPQPLIELHVLFGDDDGEMRIAALQILQLRLHHSRQRIAQPGDGQRQQHLVRVQPGIMVPQTTLS